MQSQVSWGVAVILITVAAAHIGEETLAGFRGFFNTRWFSGSKNCPVTRFKGLVFDKIGLFSILTGLAVAGAWDDARWFLIALGIVAADLVQHVVFSVGKKGYTPGVATSALYFAFVVYFLSRAEHRGLLHDPLAWVALTLGAAFIAGNYWLARRKVRRGRCRIRPRVAIRQA